MTSNVFKLRETGDVFTFKNGRPLLLQLGSLASSVPGNNFGSKLSGIKSLLDQYGINYDKLPEIGVEDAVKRFIPGAHPNAFFELAQTANLRDIAGGGEAIRTLSQPEINQAYKQKQLDRLNYEQQQSSQNSVTEQEQSVLNEVKKFLDSQYAKGNVLNPNIQITPEKMKEFQTIASNEIDPYYSTQLKLATDSFLTNVGFSKDELLRHEQIAEQKYRQQFLQLGQQAAEKGFALSGQRQREEQQLASETEQEIGSRRRLLGLQTGNEARTFAQRYGAQAIPTQTIAESPAVTAGESSFTQGNKQLPLYNLSPDVYSGLIGEQQFQQRAALRSRASELERAFRAEQALPIRSLSLY